MPLRLLLAVMCCQHGVLPIEGDYPTFSGQQVFNHQERGQAARHWSPDGTKLAFPLIKEGGYPLLEIVTFSDFT